MRVVVTGSREWKEREFILERLRRLPPTAVVRHGAAKRGADSFVDEICTELGLACEQDPADWTVKPGTPPWRIKYANGRPYDAQAGFDRNQRLIDWRPELVLAFADDLAESPGTADCIKRALRARILVEHHTLTGTELLGDTQVTLF